MSENKKSNNPALRRRKKRRSAPKLDSTSTPEKKRRKKKSNSKKVKAAKKSNNKLVFLMAVIASVCISMTVFFLFYRIAKVETGDMAPTLKEGSVVVVNKQVIPRRNSVVLIKHSGGLSASRVVAITGDTLRYHEGKLVVNGIERLQRGVSTDNQLTTEDFAIETPLPQESYYILSDNREEATDSRKLGLISSDAIIGVVETVVYP